MKRTLSRLALVKMVVLCFALFIIMVSFPLSASADVITSSSSDVVIVGSTAYGNYRYSCDIVFYNMRFTFDLRSIAYDSDVGKTSIKDGRWLMDGSDVQAATLTVINHSDTPILVTAKVNALALTQSGANVERTNGLDREVIPACVLTGDDVVISSAQVGLAVFGYPEFLLYQGVKPLLVTVHIVPTDGYTTNGSYFETP